MRGKPGESDLQPDRWRPGDEGTCYIQSEIRQFAWFPTALPGGPAPPPAWALAAAPWALASGPGGARNWTGETQAQPPGCDLIRTHMRSWQCSTSTGSASAASLTRRRPRRRSIASTRWVDCFARACRGMRLDCRARRLLGSFWMGCRLWTGLSRVD